MSTQTTLEENGTDDETETCPNGEEWCAAREEGALPCFGCYSDEAEDADDAEGSAA